MFRFPRIAALQFDYTTNDNRKQDHDKYYSEGNPPMLYAGKRKRANEIFQALHTQTDIELRVTYMRYSKYLRRRTETGT